MHDPSSPARDPGGLRDRRCRLQPGWRKAYFVCGGGISAVRSVPPGAGARLEITAALTLCGAARKNAAGPLTPDQAEDLLLLEGFVRRPPPELAVLPLDEERILAHLGRDHAHAA